jgi:hypothetical protein
MVDLSDDNSNNNDNDNDGNQSRECTPLSDHDKWVRYARQKANPTWKAKDAAKQAALAVEKQVDLSTSKQIRKELDVFDNV